jgi:hypothetical protein
MLAAVIPAALESIGDYYAAARLGGAPRPPNDIVSRALFVESLGCVVAGLFGTTSGTTAYAGGSRQAVLAGWIAEQHRLQQAAVGWCGELHWLPQARRWAGRSRNGVTAAHTTSHTCMHSHQCPTPTHH